MTPAEKKERGAYFTPQPIAQFLSDWAIRSPNDTILEPSCGEAVFLEAAGRRIAIISQANSQVGLNLRGIEIHPPSATRATERLANLGYQVDVECNDFFDISPSSDYDVVLGNPPFIRYQSFAGDSRIKALQAALAQGVPLKRLSSAWAAFLVHAAAFLKPTGRLGFVLPAELLATHYAAEVRSFLLRRFGSLKIILFEQLIFPGVMEEVILLLAEGSGGCNSFEVIQTKNIECLNRSMLRGNGYRPPHPNHKWTAGLLHQEAQEVLRDLSCSKYFQMLGDWGDIYLGFVTGNNQFFTMNNADRVKHNLNERDVIRICPPGARKINRFALTNAAWEGMRDRGEPVFLFYPRSALLNSSSKAYVDAGIVQKVHTGYKCGNREPWWRVPITQEPDLIFTYMNHQMPRIVSNEAKILVSNSVYGITLRRNTKQLGRKALPKLFFNSVSALSSELEGRSYGGGLLKVEPREADKILVPSLSLAADLAETLGASRSNYPTLQQSEYAGFGEEIDSMLLNVHSGLTKDALRIIQKARKDLFNRRMNRTRSARSLGLR
jgi:adenine-specific DNA-methyltransferase